MRESMLPLIQAWCRHYGAPGPGEPDQKMRFRANPQFAAWVLGRTVKEWKRSTADETWFNRDRLPVHPSHDWPGAAARVGLRECFTGWSCHVVLFLSLTGDCIAYQIDFDEENPLGGALKAAQHFFRILKRWRFGGETKAADARRGLEKRGLSIPREEVSL